MNHRTLLVGIFCTALFGGVLWYTMIKPSLTEQITPELVLEEDIRVELPFPGAVTGKEFSVIGEARGGWFFEASFPVSVIAESGEVLAETYATAEGDWMTPELVPFRAEVRVPESYIGKATIILKKDNPSGLPENDNSISIPIVIEY
jgi:hypothetical protein